MKMGAGQVAAIAVIALGTVIAWDYVTRPKKKRAKRKVQYVGSGWTWPNIERFPDQAAFGHALNELGYGAAVAFPGWNILSPETQKTIKHFQADYETVRKAIKIEAPTVVLGPEVKINGRVGKSTIEAFIFALDWQRNNPDDSWIALVQDAKALL